MRDVSHPSVHPIIREIMLNVIYLREYFGNLSYNRRWSTAQKSYDTLFPSRIWRSTGECGIDQFSRSFRVRWSKTSELQGSGIQTGTDDRMAIDETGRTRTVTFHSGKENIW